MPEPRGSEKSVGSGGHTLRTGECMESLAFEHGHFWKTLWENAGNSELKRERESPNVLGEGDRVTIPKLNGDKVDGAVDARHTFRRLGVPCRVLIRMLDDFDAPRESLPFRLSVDGKITEGKTDNEGTIEIEVSPAATSGKLSVGESLDEIYRLKISGIEPVVRMKGIQQRLSNLGYDCGLVDGIFGPRTEYAIRLLQVDAEIEDTGEPDDATRDELTDRHGC